MAVYDGFFDAVKDEDTGKYDCSYDASDFTGYFSNIIGSGVCVHGNENSFKVRLEDGKAVVSPGYLFIQGYWCKNDADYSIDLPGTGNYAIAAHLNLGRRMIELQARSVTQAYPDSLVLAIVSPTAAEDTRYNTDICGVIDTAGELSSKVDWAINYIDTEIESKLVQVEQDINAQEAKLDAKIAEVQAVADSITPPPVGTIKFSASQDVNDTWLKCDGSFINEADYPELVAALGKLIPSGDKFKLISSGQIGPQISNGVVYDGRMWVYSYSTKKLYGVDLAGAAAIKEIALTSDDAHFNDFIAPSTARPLALSIVPHKVGTGAMIFLTQIILDGSRPSSASSDWWKQFFAILGASFSGNETSVSLGSQFSAIDKAASGADISFDARRSVPYVVSSVESGAETYRCMCGAFYGASSADGYISWPKNGTNAVAGGVGSTNVSRLRGERTACTPKNSGESVHVALHSSSGTYDTFYDISSSPSNLFSFDGRIKDSPSGSARSSAGPINIAGADKVMTAFDKTAFVWFSYDENAAQAPRFENTPSAARVFVDAAAYLWGKDIYLIFIGTGIVFSRTLRDGSFGYLDTTSVLGTITQFGYLDYSQDEGTLYLLGQDTTNTVKVAKIVLNTLYDYANNGAWLPMIAADGVPAYIKAKEAE